MSSRQLILCILTHLFTLLVQVQYFIDSSGSLLSWRSREPKRHCTATLTLWHYGPSLENFLLGPTRDHPNGVRLALGAFLSNRSRLFFSYMSLTSGLLLPCSLNLGRWGQCCCKSLGPRFIFLTRATGKQRSNWSNQTLHSHPRLWRWITPPLCWLPDHGSRRC